MLRATETLLGATASGGVVSTAEIDDLGDQIVRLHKRKGTNEMVLAAEQKELEQIRKQLRAEAVLEVRAELDSKMAARTAKGTRSRGHGADGHRADQ